MELPSILNFIILGLDNVYIIDRFNGFNLNEGNRFDCNGCTSVLAVCCIWVMIGNEKAHNVALNLKTGCLSKWNLEIFRLVWANVSIRFRWSLSFYPLEPDSLMDFFEISKLLVSWSISALTHEFQPGYFW